MANEIKIFEEREVLGKEFKIYGSVESPLFLAKDVASWIEHSNSTEMLKRVADNEKLNSTILSAGQNREVTFLTEDGLYEVLMQSRKPIAKEFKTQVKKILKEIRQVVKSLETIEYKGNIEGLVWSKNGVAVTTSRVIAEHTGKQHQHILRDIREEVEKLKNINPKMDTSLKLIIDDFRENIYIDTYERQQIEYELGEMATMQLLLKYSAEYRAKFILMFYKMKEAINNMFKARVIENVLPQDNRLRQYIYVIKNPLNETIKIGVAQDVDKRIKQLQTGAGIELELVYQSLICSNAFSIEKDVHSEFEEYRTFGEWFKINPEIVINFLESQTFVLKSEFTKYLTILKGGIS